MAEKLDTLARNISRAAPRTCVRCSSGIDVSSGYSNAFGFIAGKRLEFTKTPSAMVFSLFLPYSCIFPNMFKVFKHNNRIGDALCNARNFLRNLVVDISLKEPNFSCKFFEMSFCRFCFLSLKMFAKIVVFMFNMQGLFVVKEATSRNHGNSLNSQINTYRIKTLLHRWIIRFQPKVKVKKTGMPIVRQVAFRNLPFSPKQFFKKIIVAPRNFDFYSAIESCKRNIGIIKTKVSRIIQTHRSGWRKTWHCSPFIRFNGFNNLPYSSASKLGRQIELFSCGVVCQFVQVVSSANVVFNGNLGKMITSRGING